MLRDARGEAETPPSLNRLLVAVGIGLLAGTFCAAKAYGVGGRGPSDFEFLWRAARLSAAGIDPYTMRPGAIGWPLADAFFYPGPALIIVWPLRFLNLALAAGLFLGISSAWLAWRLTTDGWWRLWVLGGPSFVLSAALGQWSPLLTVGALLPSAGLFLACKPTVGLACFAYHPTWRGAAGAVALGIVSLVLIPGWPTEWLANLHLVVGHPPPIAMPFGWLLLLALLRWRQREARLLIAMACVPQLLFFADQLPLGLVATTRKEGVALAACGLAALAIWFVRLSPGDAYVAKAAPYVMVGCYLPALILVLRRPNEGDVPTWIDRVAAILIDLVRRSKQRRFDCRSRVRSCRGCPVAVLSLDARCARTVRRRHVRADHLPVRRA